MGPQLRHHQQVVHGILPEGKNTTSVNPQGIVDNETLSQIPIPVMPII
jgi:hypothetical protein